MGRVSYEVMPGLKPFAEVQGDSRVHDLPLDRNGYAREALHALMGDRGVQNIEALNAVLANGAQPWWDFYGGKDQIEVVDKQT